MSEFTISPITSQIESQLPPVAAKSFGPGVGLILPKKNLWGFYAHKEGLIGGAVILKKWGPQEGSLEWIFVAPEAQGHKLGSLLFRAGMDALHEAGLTTIFSLVRGSNTASWTMFAKDGFVKPNVLHTLTKYPLKSLPHRLFYLLASGYNVWVKDPKLTQPIHLTKYAFVKSISLAVFIGAAMGSFGLASFDVLVVLVATTVSVTLVRIIAEYAVARRYGPLRFNAPQGGTILSVLLSLLSGTWWPSFGYFTPKADIYRDTDYEAINGQARFASWMSMIAVYLASALLLPETFSNGLWIILGLVIVYQSITFFPLDDFDGSRVYAYRKSLYWLGVVLSAMLMALPLLW